MNRIIMFAKKNQAPYWHLNSTWVLKAICFPPVFVAHIWPNGYRSKPPWQCCYQCPLSLGRKEPLLPLSALSCGGTWHHPLPTESTQTHTGGYDIMLLLSVCLEVCQCQLQGLYIQHELGLVCGLEGHKGVKRARVYHLTTIFSFKYSLRIVYKNTYSSMKTFRAFLASHNTFRQFCTQRGKPDITLEVPTFILNSSNLPELNMLHTPVC